MTYRRLRSRALWGGALLTGLLLAAATPASAEEKTKADAQGLDMAVGRVKQAIGEAEANGKIAPPLEQALKKLLQALDEEEREHRHHHRHHHNEGTFGAGFEQAGDPSTASDGSTDNSDPVGDSSGGSTGSGASPGLTRSPMARGAGNSPYSTTSSAQSKGNHSQNKQSQRQDPHRGGHSPFAQGLTHAERESRDRREDRRERQLEHAFTRGLTALRSAEEHSDGMEARLALSATGPMGNKASNGSKTASATPRTGPNQTVGTSPKTAERHERAWGADDEKHPNPAETPRKIAGVHPPDGGKGGSAAAHGRTGGLVCQHPSTAQVPAHPPTGSAGHASLGQHAGARAGTKHTVHKK